MRSMGSVRTAGYLTGGILLIFVFVVLLPLRIGREGGGDSLDPRTWRSHQGLSDRDAEFLESGADPNGKSRDKGLTISTRPKGARDRFTAPEQRVAWPHAAAPEVVKVVAALRAANVGLPLPGALKLWSMRTLPMIDPEANSVADVDQVVARLLAAFTESTRIAVTLRVDSQTWDRLSPRRQDRARAAIEALRQPQRGDVALGLLAGIVDAKLIVEPDGKLTIAPEGGIDLATRRWLNLCRAREAPGEESPAAWHESLERKLAETAIRLDSAGEPLDAAVARLAEAAGIPVYLDPALEPERLARKVDLRTQNLPARDCLRLLLDPLGLDVSLEADGLVVADAAQARERDRALLAPHVTAQAALERKLALDGKGLLVRALPAAIEQATGVTVVVDEAAWNRDQPLDLPAGNRSLRTTLDELVRRNQLGWRMLDGEIYLW